MALHWHAFAEETLTALAMHEVVVATPATTTPSEPPVLSKELAPATTLRPVLDAAPLLPKRSPRVPRPLPEPEPIQSRAGGWVLVTLGVCALLVYFFQRIQHTDAELGVIQQDLQTVTLERDQLKWSGQSTLEAQQAELAQTKQKLSEISAKMLASSKELKALTEKSTDREKELQDLIIFLRGEIQANEAQIELMKKSINSKMDVRRPLP